MTINKKVLYKNLRRPEVDALFSRKGICLNKVENLKYKLSTNSSEQEKILIKKRIQELKKEAELLDKSARELIKQIEEESNKQ